MSTEGGPGDTPRSIAAPWLAAAGTQRAQSETCWGLSACTGQGQESQHSRVDWVQALGCAAAAPCARYSAQRPATMQGVPARDRRPRGAHLLRPACRPRPARLPRGSGPCAWLPPSQAHQARPGCPGSPGPETPCGRCSTVWGAGKQACARSSSGHGPGRARRRAPAVAKVTRCLLAQQAQLGM